MTFRRLLGFLRPYRGQVIVSTLLAIGSQAAVLTIPYLTGRAIDATRPGHRDRSALMLYAGLIVAAGALQGVLMFFRRYLAGRLSLAVEYDLRNAMYRAPPAALVRVLRPPPDRPADVAGDGRPAVGADLPRLRADLLLAERRHGRDRRRPRCVAIDWQLALIALAISPVMMCAAYRYSRIVHPVLKDVQQRIADVTTHAEENIVGVRVVKAFAQEERETSRFAALARRVFDQAIAAARIQARYLPLLQSLPSLAVAAVLLVGGYGVIHGSLTLGSFFAVNGYLLLLVVPLRSARHVGRPVPARDRLGRADLRGARRRPRHPRAAGRRRRSRRARGTSASRRVEFGYEPGRPVLLRRRPRRRRRARPSP